MWAPYIRQEGYIDFCDTTGKSGDTTLVWGLGKITQGPVVSGGKGYVISKLNGVIYKTELILDEFQPRIGNPQIIGHYSTQASPAPQERSERREDTYSHRAERMTGHRDDTPSPKSGEGGGLMEKFWLFVCIYVFAALALCAFYDYCIVSVWNFFTPAAWQLSEPCYGDWVLAPLTLLLMILNWIFY